VKIAILYPDDFSIWQFRKGMIKALIEKGHEVYTLCPYGAYVNKLESLGTKQISIEIHRFISPLKDLKYLLRLYRIFREYRFDVIHNLTIKPNIYGAIAARLAGAKTILGSVEGLGSIYSENSELIIKLLRPVINILYRIGCHLSDRFWFLNEDDLSYFINKKMIDMRKAVLIKSTGVNMKEYSPESVNLLHVEELQIEFKIDNSTNVVLMVAARYLWSKGIKEAVEAYEILRYKYPNIRFILVGSFEEGSPDSVPKKYLSEKTSDSFYVLNFRNDIKELITLSDLVIHPSYYREGVPRILLEAMSLGKPIVTTNNVGCKEVVDDDKNGFLIPIHDSNSLADRIDRLLSDSELTKRFGNYSKEKVQNEFDEKLIVDQLMKSLYQL